MPEDKEKQQDFYIHETRNIVSNMRGQLFGEGNTPGILGTIQKQLEKVDGQQGTILQQINSMHTDSIEKYSELSGRFEKVEDMARRAHDRIDEVEPRVKTLEDRPGKNLKGVFMTVLKPSVSLTLVGLGTLIGLGIKTWLGG